MKRAEIIAVHARARLFAVACLGMAFAAVTILVYSGGQVSHMTSGDALFYRYVAENLDIEGADLDPVVAAKGPSLRYGRIALPAMIWLFSGGQRGAMPYVQPIIMILAAGAIAGAASKLLPDRKMLVSLLPFLALGLSLSVAGGYTETVAVVFALWAVVAARAERWVSASVLLVIAMLSRENALVILIGLGAWCMITRRWRSLAILACSLAPVAAWHAVVAYRFGHLPLSDPYLWAGAGAGLLPFVSLLKGLISYSAVASLTAAVHAVLGIVAVVLAVSRRTLIAVVAATAGLQLAAVPLLNWKFPGDTFRLFSLLEVLTVLSVVEATAHESVQPRGVMPARSTTSGTASS